MANPILGFGGQEVNPTEMIRIPVHFGDKSKFKTLEEVKASMNKRGWGYTSGSPPSSRPSSSDTPASASKGLVASSSAASPSDEEGINSTSSGSRPSAAAYLHSSTKHRPQNTDRLRIRLQGLARPCGGRRGRPSGLADSPAPWPGPHQSRPSPADAASLFHGPLGPLGASYNAFAAGTLRPPLPPGQRPQPLLSPPRTPLGGLKPQGRPSPRT
ncbi:LOW QUALITY PROTEIN: hypothetical protein Cgig2_000619 [Carnegiea gigantea]|uniref:Uncharacterized protein n=1 Tax=Carnegiea gigantea TaxID=171969 RepID=A0A9Q1JED4_9CARY|nr:LOW QUALITY PROTEIN: hypothetical protein Cgig2_000619 [Carnegiea gigantea]